MKTHSALLALCEEIPWVTGGSPHKTPMMPSFNVFFWYSPKQAVEQAVELLVTWYANMLV